MMICSGLVVFILGAMCSIACIAVIPAVYKNSKKKEAAAFCRNRKRAVLDGYRKSVEIYRCSMLVLALPICMMPLLKIAGYELSLLDFASMSGDFDNFLAQFGEFTEFIREELASYRFVCVVIMVIPVCAAIATALLKGNGVVLSATAAALRI